MGVATNDAPYCFWQARVEHAARQLALVLEEEEADILTTYDDNGGYGHPDHIQVHRVGKRAGELAGTPKVFETTMNRDHLRRGIEGRRELAVAAGIDTSDLPDVSEDSDFGKPEAI